MNIDDQQVQALLGMLALTKDVESDCDHCLQHMAEFAEAELSGKSISEALICIDEHLERCGECREEYAALKEALGGELPAS